MGWGTSAQHFAFGVNKVGCFFFFSEARLFPEGDFMLPEHPTTQPRAWSPLQNDAQWGQGPPCHHHSLGHIHTPALGAGWPGNESAVSAEKM